MKVIALVLTLVMIASAQQLPDAPSSVKRHQTIATRHDSTTAESFVEPPPVEHHRGRTIALIAIVTGGLATGLVVGLLKHSGNCPSTIWYNGKSYPYSGSYDDQHPCPTEPPGIGRAKR